MMKNIIKQLSYEHSRNKISNQYTSNGIERVNILLSTVT